MVGRSTRSVIKPSVMAEQQAMMGRQSAHEELYARASETFESKSTASDQSHPANRLACHSLRKATIGSTCDALRAGK